MNILFASMMLLNIVFSVISPQDISGLTTDCKPHYLDNYYLPAWVTNDTWYREMPQYTVGKAVWYAPGLMNSTALVRGMNLEGFQGGVATNSVDMMGKIVWLRRQGLPWEGPFLVVDVSQRNHAYHHAVNVKSIVEVDFDTAIKWGIVSYNQTAKRGYVINKWSESNVEMWVGLEAPEEINENPVIYSEWYMENAEFCDGQPNRRWKTADWMIMNYENYEEQLSKQNEVIAFTPIQQSQNIVHKVLPRQQERAQLFDIVKRHAVTRPFVVGEKIAPNFAEVVPVGVPTTTISAKSSSVPEITTTHVLRSNETWTHLALRYYGHTTEPYWRLIYEANIDTVGDDYHHIWGGMEVVIPAIPADFSP